MKNDRDFERATAEWLDAGSDPTPPHVIAAVLLAARNTPQERDFRIPWRTLSMRNPMYAAAVIVVIMVSGLAALYAFGPGPKAGGPPTGSPESSTSPTPVSSALESHAASPALIEQVIEAINSRDIAALRSSFTADATVVLPHLASDGELRVMAAEFEVSIEDFLAAWMSSTEAWDLEADLGSCRYLGTISASIQCDVTTRWLTLQVEMGELWTFAFGGTTGLTRLEMDRIDPNPANRTLPLGLDDLAAWETWLNETDPERAARLLSGDELFWNFYFRYRPEKSEDIGASISEYLASR
jgi:hypothetical protein